MTDEPSCKDEARIGQKKAAFATGADAASVLPTFVIGATPGCIARFALVMPEVSTEAMNLFLAAFSKHLAADKHAVLSLDQAVWHGATALHVPPNITLVALPPHSPELNPVERLWLYLRERYLSHRLLDDYDTIVADCCHAWNQLTPERRFAIIPTALSRSYCQV